MVELNEDFCEDFDWKIEQVELGGHYSGRLWQFKFLLYSCLFGRSRANEMNNYSNAGDTSITVLWRLAPKRSRDREAVKVAKQTPS
jgi:hypothetical protein